MLPLRWKTLKPRQNQNVENITSLLHVCSEKYQSVMATRRLFKYSLVSGISVASYFLGSYCERLKYGKQSSQENEDNSKFNQNTPSKWPVLPALPIFGTVSAATPFSPAVVQSSSTSQCLPHITHFGFPSFDQIREFENYILSYDRRNRVPHWVFEHITPENIKKSDSVDRSLSEFKADEKIHPYFRAENSDYKRSGYDRGHMAAAGNYKNSQKHVDETFYLTNMAPQVGVGFNRDSWNKLERHVRRLSKTYPHIYVCTGPLYLPRKGNDGKNYVKYEVIGAKNIAVPTHFFKILVGETPSGVLEMEAYVMPNEAIDNEVPLTSFQVPPESIERAAGLLFFDRVSKSRIKKINGKQN